MIRIGLTTYRERSAFGVWDERADLLPATYADSIAAAGAMPMLLPPAAADLAAADQDGADLDGAVDAALDAVDGLALTGGPDVDPARYRAHRSPRTGAPRPARDAWEIALVHAAIARRMPLLAICRGMQVLNVALGGTLVQHLPDSVGHEAHCPTVGVHGRHAVRFAPGSTIAAMLGDERSVATYHHQALDTLGDGLAATGWAEDGIVEAVESDGSASVAGAASVDGVASQDGSAWVVGVQWHPEVHDGAALFAGFRVQCERFRSSRAAIGA